MKQRPLNPDHWPDPLRPQRPMASLDLRLRQMREEAKRSHYGSNDRQGLMVNPEEIMKLLTLLELDRGLKRVDRKAAGDLDAKQDAVQVDLAGALRAMGLNHIADELEIVK